MTTGGRGEAQISVAAAWSTGTTRVRVIAHRNLDRDVAKVRQLMAAFESGINPPGLPRGLLDGVRVTISLAEEFDDIVEGSAHPASALIILPITSITKWQQRQVMRVVRHEVAHLAMARVVEITSVPYWFREGYAEWAAVGLSCEAELQIRLDRLARPHDPPTLARPAERVQSRLSYAYFAAFFSHLDRVGGAVKDGSLLRAVGGRGVERGVAAVFQKSIETLEAEWQSDLALRFRDIPDGFSCQ